MTFSEVNNLVDVVHQSPPVDTTAPYDTTSLAGKTVVITGGAAGFGAAFARHWAQCGAHIVVGDINDAAGEALIAELRTTTPGGEHHHFQHCDVTSWPDQTALFRTAVEHSTTGCIHAVVPSAGIVEHNGPESGLGFENPAPPPGSPPNADPAPPQLDVVQVNYIGVLYSVHLAMYWLPKGSETSTDRHILLINSMAGIISLPGRAHYSASKHAVTGLFRTLRSTVHRQGIRINMLCPYFAPTDMISTIGRVLLAGGGLADVADVVDAGTRLMADESIAGHALAIGPRMLVTEGQDGQKGQVTLVGLPEDAPAGAGQAKGQAVWECYAEDYANCDLFLMRYFRLLNGVTILRGWTGVVKDMYKVLEKRWIH